MGSMDGYVFTTNILRNKQGIVFFTYLNINSVIKCTPHLTNLTVLVQV